MNMDTYQIEARKTAMYNHDELYPVLALGEEAGEVQKLYAKRIRDGRLFTKEQLKAELGDVLWMVANIAMDAGIMLNDVAEYNVEKLQDRMARGVIQGDGDNR